jgi:hypothetical protein
VHNLNIRIFPYVSLAAEIGALDMARGKLMGSFGKGDRVLQKQYGAGDILAVDDRYTTIQFDSGLVRKFLTTLLTLQPTSEPRPVESPTPKRRGRRRRIDAEASGEAEGESRNSEARRISTDHVEH